ncbi:MAG TPA: SDR family oxidoreductase [Gammaproteobacteria bacterium]
MRVLIIGATGGTGMQLVRQAVARGHEVTAFVRKPSRFRLTDARLKVVQGDVMDAASVRQAMSGQEAVLCALGHKRWLYPTRILSQGTANILSSMRDSGVRRLVCETSLSVGDSRGRMGLYYTLFVIPFILPFYFWDKGRQEKIIRGSDVDWVIVRPGALNNGRARGRYRHGAGLGSFLWTVRISRADTAAFMLDQLTSGRYLRATPGVCW